jgi:hypothetical protein
MADPREEMNELLNACLPFARQMIEQHGEFHPFGASMTPDGTLHLDGVDPGEEFPPGQDVVELLSTAMRTKAELHAINAAAICANVDMKLPSGQTQDVIQVANRASRCGTDPRVHALSEETAARV